MGESRVSDRAKGRRGSHMKMQSRNAHKLKKAEEDAREDLKLASESPKEDLEDLKKGLETTLLAGGETVQSAADKEEGSE